MNGQLFQARSRDNLQLDMVHCHQAELRRETEAIRSSSRRRSQSNPQSAPLARACGCILADLNVQTWP